MPKLAGEMIFLPKIYQEKRQEQRISAAGGEDERVALRSKIAPPLSRGQRVTCPPKLINPPTCLPLPPVPIGNLFFFKALIGLKSDNIMKVLVPKLRLGTQSHERSTYGKLHFS
jgi:hypothetical protein